MKEKKSFELLEAGVLKKGVRVKMAGLAGLEDFHEVERAYVKKARPFELEDDWVVVTLKDDAQVYDSAWITEIEGYKGEL